MWIIDSRKSVQPPGSIMSMGLFNHGVAHGASLRFGVYDADSILDLGPDLVLTFERPLKQVEIQEHPDLFCLTFKSEEFGSVELAFQFGDLNTILNAIEAALRDE